ncbi:hypothetical protein FDY95_24710 [Hymenobacter jeollabukensis]|uniref:Uncharacterized protein n=1 Tax=Hymenobacter jeollabukensis TaxID=2025313 RepID=A0A5R8WI26_9BACT|nr:hypothetical protein FDY95_24710 [Hymenobacter jeollabukensis]
MNFTGNAWQDDLSVRTATFVARQLQEELNQDRGLRIEFEAGSHYQALVRMLDLMLSTDQKRYWLDLRRLPVSLNAFTAYHPPSDTVEVDLGRFLCDDVIPHTPPTPPPPLWHHQLRAELAAAFRLSTWRPLFSPAWRYSTLLLLLLPPAAAWQLQRLFATNFRH